MNELNLDPNLMVDAALGRISSGSIDVGSLSVQGLERASVAVYDGIVRATDIYNVASIGLANASSDRLNWNWLNSFEWVEVWKTIAFFVTLILLIVFVSIWLRLRILVKPEISIADQIIPPEPAPGGPMTARWEEIQRHLDSVKEAEWKFAIIEADKLADDALRKAGFPGVGLGERLSNISPDTFQSLNELWEAHKVRNRIAHETTYFLRYTEAKHAIEQYGKALSELGAI